MGVTHSENSTERIVLFSAYMVQVCNTWVWHLDLHTGTIKLTKSFVKDFLI